MHAESFTSPTPLWFLASFHQLGAAKWAELKLPYQLTDVAPPSQELIERVENQFRSYGLNVV